ncbi:hypothetical protein ACHAXR_005765 [Thalassiosira sp. AJA248-18]
MSFSLRCISASSRVMVNARRAGFSTLSSTSLLGLRGGADDGASSPTQLLSRDISSSSAVASATGEGETKFVTLDNPAPGSPFHYAFPVHSLTEAKNFYGNILGCAEGRSSEKWQDYSLHGHQIVCHWVGNDYRCVDYYNPVDGDEVPVPHAGLAVTLEQFHALAERVREAGVKFIIEPHLRFQGAPGEQWTMFFKDPSGNNLEFKAMTKAKNLFAQYNVVD